MTSEWLDILDWSEDEIEDIRFVGYSYIQQGQYDTACIFFEALNVLTPNNAYDLQTLGALYLQKDDNLQALNYLNQALKIEPNHFPSLLNRAKALFALGYKKQGEKEVRNLQRCKDRGIANQATALLTIYA